MSEPRDDKNESGWPRDYDSCPKCHGSFSFRKPDIHNGSRCPWCGFHPSDIVSAEPARAIADMLREAICPHCDFAMLPKGDVESTGCEWCDARRAALSPEPQVLDHRGPSYWKGYRDGQRDEQLNSAPSNVAPGTDAATTAFVLREIAECDALAEGQKAFLRQLAAQAIAPRSSEGTRTVPPVARVWRGRVTLYQDLPDDTLLYTEPPSATASRAIADVSAERRRQVEGEGWTAAHDDQHTHGDLAQAAACYAIYASGRSVPPDLWPWAMEWWKPKDRRRDLVRAAALVIAEIDRLDRAMDSTGASK